MGRCMAKAADNVRYERKFLVSSAGRREAEHLIRLHRGMFGEMYPPRQINNIYLESRDWRMYQSSLRGDRERQKIRIRWYGPLAGEAERPVLEIKRKSGAVGWKETYPLREFPLAEELGEREIRKRIEEADLPERLRSELGELHPILLNCYQRKYYQSRRANARLTLDWDLSCCRFTRPGHRFSMTAPQRENLVLELKYDAGQEEEVCLECGDIPFTMTKSSKYVTAVESLFGRG